MSRIRLPISVPLSFATIFKLTLLSQLQRPHSGRDTRQRTGNHLRDLQTMLERSECTPRSASTCSVYLRRVRVGAKQVHHLGVRDWVHRGECIDEKKVDEWARVEEGIGKVIVGVAILGIVTRRPRLLVVVVTQALELVQVSAVSEPKGLSCWHSLIAKLAGDKQVTAFQHAKTRRDRDGIEVFDLDRVHILVCVVDRNLEQVAVL
jgi:hypothetical protein